MASFILPFVQLLAVFLAFRALWEGWTRLWSVLQARRAKKRLDKYTFTVHALPTESMTDAMRRMAELFHEDVGPAVRRTALSLEDFQRALGTMGSMYPTPDDEEDADAAELSRFPPGSTVYHYADADLNDYYTLDPLELYRSDLNVFIGSYVVPGEPEAPPPVTPEPRGNIECPSVPGLPFQIRRRSMRTLPSALRSKSASKSSNSNVKLS